MTSVDATTSGTEVRDVTWNADTIAVVAGLTIAWALGFVGAMLAPAGTTRDVAYAISSMGLVAGAAVLAVRHLTTNTRLAAGLLVLVVGEGVIHSQGSGGSDAFAAATFSYVPGLLLIASSGWGRLWARLTALGAAAAFAAHALAYLLGAAPTPEAPAASIGYVMLALTLIGWSWQVVRGQTMRRRYAP